MELRSALASQLKAARRITDAIFARLSPAAFQLRPIAERHRLIFYVGHVDAFDWNLLCRDIGRAPSKQANWEQLFSFGIDPVDGRLPAEPADAWPLLSDVQGWVQSLRQDVDRAVESLPFEGWLQDGWALRMAVEHRLMHAETLMYLLSRVPAELRAPGRAPVGLERPSPRNELIEIPGGPATLGHARAHEGWDNEYAQHRVQVPAFEVQRFPVTNGEYLRFIDAGGYQTREWWSDGAWTWRAEERLEQPAFWKKSGDAFLLRTLSGDVPLPLSFPVYVSHAEASAFARWSRLSLPTEAQWHRAALDERRFPWGDAEPQPGIHGNFGFVHDDPCAVDAHPRGESAFGVAGMMGNGWQWTRSVFAPFEGFAPLPFYAGYSQPFFDGRHFVMKGASPATDVAFLRPSFRNWFQPHYPHVFATFRLVAEGKT